MESSDVVKGTAAEATAYNLLRADVITNASGVATIQAAASFHADYVQFEDEARFEGDANFKAYKDGATPIYQLDTGVVMEWDDNAGHINMKIAATVVGYFDASGWHNL